MFLFYAITDILTKDNDHNFEFYDSTEVAFLASEK